MVPRAWKRRDWELLFNMFRISAEDDGEILEVGSTDVCSVMCMHFMPLNTHVVHSMLCL